MTNRNQKKISVVTGDQTIDWNLALFPSAEYTRSSGDWWKDTGARTYQQFGGAALLKILLTKLIEKLHTENNYDWEIRSIDLPAEPILPDDRRFHHSHSIWSRFAGEEQAWRVKEYLGLAQQFPQRNGQWQKIVNDPPKADIVILDDANLGFRDNPDLWPKAIMSKNSESWILVKMARPIARGKLWEHLLSYCDDQVIVVMTVNDLRRTEVQISRELSWERTAHDLYWELTHNPLINSLSRCAFVIVSFDTAGAFLLSRSKNNNSFDATLFYDNGIIEGMWNQALPGGMIGYTSCLVAGIAKQLILNSSNPNLTTGVQTGLAAMRLLHQKGYTSPDEENTQKKLSFPVNLIAAKLDDDNEIFKTATVPSPVRFLSGMDEKENRTQQEGGWSILHDKKSNNLEQVANNIVLSGIGKALNEVPLGQFGKLITADRREVESFRSIRSLIGEYCGQLLNKPLSIAVFGPPGSGKSFAVKQIAASVKPGEIMPLEFNLSQLGSVDDLYDAFHQVRDASLSGKLPLVFWDEFDSAFNNQMLGWLRYFLAPMQDGVFQESQIIHPIGRCIFVFAGGTCCRMEDFTLPNQEIFIAMKGPDFVSRLKGYINILGPNPYITAEGATDTFCIIRRAIVLRVILNLNVPQIFHRVNGVNKPNIDRGVLNALLKISAYKHGVRSIESIIAMSSLSGKNNFERSSLPSEDQLKLHVDGREFLALSQQIELSGELLEKLAEAAHNIYWEGKLRDGWKLGPRKEKKKTHPLLMPYTELKEEDKELNRVNVRNIPTKLAAVGYIMVPARSDEKPLNFPGDDLEKLASIEHDLYVKEKQKQGFTQGEPTADNPNRNPYLIEWEKIPEEIKVIDRDLVSGIPDILAKAGYAVKKLE
jgi:hypothetical protein